MKTVLRMLMPALVLGVATLSVSYAKPDESEDGGKGRAKRTARTPQKPQPNTSAVGSEFAKEFAALTMAAEALDGVTDEKSAAAVAKKLQHDFTILPVPMGGSDAMLLEYAKVQNRVNLKMEKMKNEPWFVSSGMQEAWTLITVPSTRRTATLKR